MFHLIKQICPMAHSNKSYHQKHKLHFPVTNIMSLMMMLNNIILILITNIEKQPAALKLITNYNK